MAWTQANLEAIDAAILQAIQGKSVTFADRSWTSQDLAALRELRAEIAQALTATTAGGAGSSRLAAVRKGV